MAADQQVSSSDFDHYAAAPGSLAFSITSSDSLARAGGLFGVDWYYSWLSDAVTSIDGVSMQGRADGVQELATATYRTFMGVEEAIEKLSVADPVLVDWLEKIYDQLYTSSLSGDVVTKTSVADLLASFPSFGGDSLYSPRIYNGNGSYTYLPVYASARSYLAAIANDLYYLFSSQNYSILGPDGGYIYTAQNHGLGYVMSSGLVGLAHLFFGDTSHPIYGLSYTGQDKESVRGAWSLADITANGMQGLATLIGGQDGGEGRKAVWQWVDPSDPLDTTKIRNYEATSLFDLFHQIAWLQNSLAKLEYVYASEEDMEFKEQEKPNMDAVKDNFFGDGEGAVSPDQIKEVAGIGSDLKAAFDSPVSIADFFKMLSSSVSYNFFSQESASDMNPLAAGGGAAAASADDSDPFADLVQGEDGLWYPESSMFDLYSYLEGLS